MVLRALVALLCFLALAPAASAQPAPQNLRAFVLRANEPEDPTRTFSRTPAFAWNPVNGATSYEFQISTSRTFAENAIVWEKDDIAAPLTNVPLTLPWITGAPYSFYARVRTNVRDDSGPWSERYGFRMRAPAPPATLTPSGVNPRPGMVRWTPVDGATAYEVAFQYSQAAGMNKRIKTATTAADLREYYTLHNWVPNVVTISWRVRAVREVEGRALNNMPSVSYGPWSAQFTTNEPPLAVAPITPLAAVSRSRASDIENTSAPGAVEPHELIPGFHWSGVQNMAGFGDTCAPAVAAFNVTCPLFHVYVYTDEDCVNRVHVSDLVGSPAYVPRLTPALDLPGDPDELSQVVTPSGVLILEDGEEGEVFDAGDQQVHAAGTDPDLPPLPAQPEGSREEPDRRSGIWDNDWPDSRYYWTVVPAVPRLTVDNTVEYHDIEFGEEMCRQGRMLTFGKTSAPAIERENGVPFLSGMVTTGQIRAATSNQPRFFGRVLVAWRPAPGATRYQIQWSRKASPFKPVGSVTTPNTAHLLGLDPGVWYYRVRGLDESIPSLRQGMTWSDPQYVRISPRIFSVVRRPR